MSKVLDPSNSSISNVSDSVCLGGRFTDFTVVGLKSNQIIIGEDG